MVTMNHQCALIIVDLRKALLAVVLATNFALSSHAEVIPIPPQNVSASSEIPGFDRIDDYLVDESGFFDGEHDVIPDGGMWLSSGTAFGGDDLDPFVIFDLGAVYTITSFHVWNYNEVGDFALRGVDGVTVEYGTTDALGATVPGITNFEIALGEDGDTGEEFDDFPPFSARFIKFAIESNYGGDNNFYGLSEVQFDGVVAGVALSSNTVITSASAGTNVGTLSTPSGNLDDDTFSYTLMAGDGDSDNAKFQIAGDQLQAGAHDFSGAEGGDTFSVRVRSTAAPSGDEFESVLTIIAIADSDSDSLVDSWEESWAGDDNLGDLSGLADADADGDTLTDLQEFNLREQFPNLSPVAADSDGDGLNDGEEIAGAGQRPPTDPTNGDTDGDTLSDQVETNTGTIVGPGDTGSNPTLVDTDGDGQEDQVEVAKGSDPSDPNSLPAVVPSELIQVVDVTASTEIPGFDRIDDYLIDESGLFDGEHDVAPDGFMWLSSGTDFGGDDLDPFVIFDLGEVYTITSFHVWNYNEAGAFALRGVDEVTVQYGTTEALGSTVPGITNFVQASGVQGDLGEEFDGFGPFSARYIKFDFDSNHGGDNNFYGLSEVQFSGRITDIALTPNSVITSSSAGTTVGTLTNPAGSDGDTFTYGLIEGGGDTDNDKFQIVGDTLQTLAPNFLGAADGSLFSVRVQSTGAPSGEQAAAILTIVAVADSDADNLIDSWEELWAGAGNLNVLSGIADADNDADGLTDLQEFNLRTQFPDLSPIIADTDGDGLNDGDETGGAGARPATDPTNADTDGDTLNDSAETNTGVLVGENDTGSNPTLIDSDGDGHEDPVEVAKGSNPNDANSVPAVIPSDIIPVAEVIASTEIPGFDRIDDYIIDESGLEDGEHGNAPDGFMWLSSGTAFGGDDEEPAVLFDLGEIYTITKIHVWNYNEVNLPLRGIDEVAIEYGDTEDLGATVPGITNFTVAEGAEGYTGEEFDGFAPFSARFINFAITSNHGGDNNFYGLSEVQFTGTLGAVGFDFAITDIAYDSGAPSVTLTFNSVAGKTYAVDSSTDLITWIEADDSIPSGGEKTTFTDSFFVGQSPFGYYRVREVR